MENGSRPAVLSGKRLADMIPGDLCYGSPHTFLFIDRKEEGDFSAFMDFFSKGYSEPFHINTIEIMMTAEGGYQINVEDMMEIKYDWRKRITDEKRLEIANAQYGSDFQEIPCTPGLKACMSIVRRKSELYGESPAAFGN